MGTFSQFNLSPEDQKKARRILRRLASKEYFGDVDNLLVRIVATQMSRVDLMEEADKMQSWCHEKRKKFSTLRYNNWTKRANSKEDEDDIGDELSRELKKVEEFKRKQNEKKKHTHED